MKKRIFLTAMLLVLTLCLAGCYEEEEPEHVLNAEIIEVDEESKVIKVKDSGEEEIFGEISSIDCGQAESKYKIFYYNYENTDMRQITLADLQVGDEIILYLYESEFTRVKEKGTAIANQVQLSTQRLN